MAGDLTSESRPGTSISLAVGLVAVSVCYWASVATAVLIAHQAYDRPYPELLISQPVLVIGWVLALLTVFESRFRQLWVFAWCVFGTVSLGNIFFDWYS